VIISVADGQHVRVLIAAVQKVMNSGGILLIFISCVSFKESLYVRLLCSV